MNTNTRSLKLFIILLTLTAGALGASTRASGIIVAESAADETAIRENVKQMETGWNQKSGALFAKPFAENADYVVINGMHIRGRDRIGHGHQGIFDTFMKDSHIKLSVDSIRFLRPEVAIVHVNGHLRTAQGGGARESAAHMTLIMSKEKDGWRIAAFQNTEVVNQ